MNTPSDASDDQIAKLFGDELKPHEAMAAAIDRVNELMRPALNPETLANGRHNEIDLRGRHICFEFHGTFRGKHQWTCWDANVYDGDESDMGFGESMEMALADLFDKMEPEPEPAPRLRMVDGGGGVQPPEFEPAPYVDPDNDFDADLEDRS